jgi:hypothetical protein
MPIASRLEPMNNWPALIALSVVLLVAMILVAWAALTLGNPKRSYGSRPLPYPKKSLEYPRHQRDSGRLPVQDQHLASGYVTTRRIKIWSRPR